MLLSFWEYCFRVSQFVWETSLQQRAFPPSSLSDLFYAARHFRPQQLSFATLAFRSMAQLLKQHGLDQNPDFVAFVNEQLLITAQNYLDEVNVLFGATALCYTNYGNYYQPGGLIQLINPLVDYLKAQGGRLELRQPVTQVQSVNGHYELTTQYRQETRQWQAQRVLSAIPANNTADLFADPKVQRHLQRHLLPSEQLNSAFQMGFVFKKTQRFDCLHHQLHLPQPLPVTGSHSVFLSLSHPDDSQRCGLDEVVGSISTHVPHPAATLIDHKEKMEQAIFDLLDARGLVPRQDVTYHHSSTPGGWEKWTGRAWGFVGGYPQYMRIKPWQMLDARLDHRGAYLCGDSTYPGQGIPGACLSGIIAHQKMKMDER